VLDGYERDDDDCCVCTLLRCVLWESNVMLVYTRRIHLQ